MLSFVVIFMAFGALLVSGVLGCALMAVAAVLLYWDWRLDDDEAKRRKRSDTS